MPKRLLAELHRRPLSRMRAGRFGAVRRPLRARDADSGARSPASRRARAFAQRRISRRSSHASCKSWVGRPTALTYAPHADQALGRAGVAQARGPRAHRRAQDQQRHRPGAAGASAWAPSASWPKPAPVSTASRARPRRARLGLPCTVYMGEVDMERQAPNVGRMRLLGATVVPVTSGDRTLRAAIDEAMRDWVSDPDGTYYLLGSAVGPHPYPYLVRELQAVIGREARAQMLERTGALPRCGDRLRRRRFQRHRHVPSVHRGSQRRRSSASRRAAAARDSGKTRRRSTSAARACCTAATQCCCRTRTDRSRRPFGVGGPGLSGRRPRARAAAADRARAVRVGE